MPDITFEGKRYDCAAGETVLDALTRHGVLLPSGCRSGSCHACKVRAVKGSPPDASQQGLKETLKARNYFLACTCRPETDLEIAVAEASEQLRANVIEKSWLNADVVRIRLSKPTGFSYNAGQFINLVRSSDQLVRSYSLASINSDDYLELHIKRIADGRMSSWVCDQLQVGDSIDFFGPSGNCFYVPGNRTQPLLLAGTGTGLAPLFGIARDAIASGHSGEIRLFHASLNSEGLYYIDQLTTLSTHHQQLTYTASVLHGDKADHALTGPVDQVVVDSLGDLSGYRVFLCGDAPVVEQMQRSFFFAGASMQDIHADAFAFTPEG